MLSKAHLLTALAVTALLAACASKPTNMPSISADTNAANEIAKTERMISDARQDQVDVLSPKNFTKAEDALAKAKKMKDKDKPNQDIINELAISQGFLMEAKEKSEISVLSMKNITTARADAMRAQAPDLLSKEWKDTEKDLEKVTKKIEKGNLTQADKEGDDIIARYRDLEIKAVQKANLGVAWDNIQRAKKADAEKKAPKSWNMAMMKYDNASKIITSNPKNSEAIRSASSDATRESVHLTEVTNKVNAGNSEDLVLMAERQQRTISGLRNEASSTEKELAATEKQAQSLAKRQKELEKSEDALQAAESIRSHFKPNEAEVFVQDNKVMVRLKALQFPTAQANLGAKNKAFLKKVETALQDVDMTRMTVEGHTDSTGNADKNAILSEKRAQSVSQYLTASGGVPAKQVQAVGLGSDKPISDNSTAQGRAQNRRIDLVIETH